MTTLSAVTRGASLGRICLLAALAASCGGDDVPGSIRVTVTTRGTSLDADGYTVTAAGTTQAVSANGETTLADLTPGRYSVSLSEVAVNCSVRGDNPVTVELESGVEAGAAFDVTCAIPGVVRVRTTTSGWDYDLDGYLVNVDGAAPQRIAASGVTNLISTSRGMLAVTIGDVSPECTADPRNAASVPAPAAGEVSEIALAFQCPTLTGGLTITVERGFVVRVDGAELPPASDTSLTLARLAPGVHALEYHPGYLASGCTVNGPTPTLATVVLGAMTDVSMPLIDCSGAF
jgi:hypothetical protein